MAVSAEELKNLDSSLKGNLKSAEERKGKIRDNMEALCEILEEEIVSSKSSNEEKKALLKWTDHVRKYFK